MYTSDLLITHSQIFTADKTQPIIRDGAIVIKNQQIVWVGESQQLPSQYYEHAEQQLSFRDGWLTPGLIDCHTHLIYAGNRSHEFRRQLEGESYQQISASGGGILATVAATRQADESQLYTQAARRLTHWLNQGVTHLEIKSGYGLNLESELKMLRVARTLETNYPVSITTSLLAAHTLAPEYNANHPDIETAKEAYIEYICDTIIPAAVDQQLVDHIDGFCENIAFNTAQIERLFKTAQHYHLPIKLHAEQLSNQQGSLLAAHYQALSVDHLEYLDETSIQAMADSGTVAVLLPAAFYFLNETKQPPVQLLRQYGIPIAIASDHNPGSAPIDSVSLVFNMACRLFGLTPDEALYGMTINAAKALAIDTVKGSIEVGKQADILHWPVTAIDDLSYYFGAHQPDFILRAGDVLRSPVQ